MVITALLIAGAAVSWYVHEEVESGSRFSTRAASALDDSDVRTVLADRMVGGLTRSVVPDALVVRPLLVPALATLADTSAFGDCSRERCAIATAPWSTTRRRSGSSSPWGRACCSIRSGAWCPGSRGWCRRI